MVSPLSGLLRDWFAGAKPAPPTAARRVAGRTPAIMWPHKETGLVPVFLCLLVRPSARSLEPGAVLELLLTLDTQHPAPSTQHPAPSTQLPAPSSQLPAPSSQLPAPSPQRFA